MRSSIDAVSSEYVAASLEPASISRRKRKEIKRSNEKSYIIWKSLLDTLLHVPAQNNVPVRPGAGDDVGLAVFAMSHHIGPDVGGFD